MILPSLAGVPVAVLRTLSASLRGGRLSLGISKMALQPILGVHAAPAFEDLAALGAQGLGPVHLAAVVDALVQGREVSGAGGDLLDLILTGPEVPSVPLGDTSAAFSALVAEAHEEVLLVGYAVHQGARIFESLAERMAVKPELKVLLCLDVARRPNDTSLESEIVRRFATDFRGRQWPWSRLPEVYYDPRSLSADAGKRSSLHAKCVVIDRRVALVTSANFTEAAHDRNIEVGVLIRHGPTACRLADYFAALMQAGKLTRLRFD